MTDRPVKFTPGPWAIFEDDERFEVAVGQIGEDRICEPLGDTPEQATANGYLIATAPKLYAALAAVERIVLEQRCERGTPWDLACTTIAEKLREYAAPILAQARGEQP